MNMYAQPIDTDNSVVIARGKGGGWVEVGKVGERGTSVIVSTIKINFKTFPLKLKTQEGLCYQILFVSALACVAQQIEHGLRIKGSPV